MFVDIYIYIYESMTLLSFAFFIYSYKHMQAAFRHINVMDFLTEILSKP